MGGWVWEENNREMFDMDVSESNEKDELRLVKVIRASVSKS